jgi:ribosomal protein RSM22 (predicted rRNA methylase)
LKGLAESGEVFDRYIRARKTPLEAVNLKQKFREIEDLVLSNPEKYKLPKVPPQEADDIQLRMFNNFKDQTIKQIAKQRVYSWPPINYDHHKSFLYLMSRSAEEYAVIMRTLSEIQKRDPTFQPQSFFDFGAGVGTGTWAASELWKSTISIRIRACHSEKFTSVSFFHQESTNTIAFLAFYYYFDGFREIISFAIIFNKK